MRKVIVAFVVALGALLPAGITPAALGQQGDFQPGAPGAGDPYFPLDGNGGYNVKHYTLDVAYDPETNRLTGIARIRARATQDLSRFNLDLDGLTVRSINVNAQEATWTRSGGELTITPDSGLPAGEIFITRVSYDGVPKPIFDALGKSGFLHTDDGALIAGQPHVASTWFPVNDHPSDKASYTFRVTVPEGLEAVANGTLEDTTTADGSTTWTWEATEPMASYLATATVGEFDLDSYTEEGIRYWDALDPDLLDPIATPRTGTQFAISHRAEPSYKRLGRVINVPNEGAKLTFWINRDTEPFWDFVFVEAHTFGKTDWTTLGDLNGHTSDNTGFVCPYWLQLHPFLRHYQTAKGSHGCSPTGTTGKWRAASGESKGWEKWRISLSRFAGSKAKVFITYASDDFIQHNGVMVDDIEVSTGAGTTSFEDDGNTMDGWIVPGPHEGSRNNSNDWTAGTSEDIPPPPGERVHVSFGRQSEIIDFLAGNFGPYPFSAAGGIVDDLQGVGFALENQTRPIYSKDFFRYYQHDANAVVVHELAHQWYGDSLTLAKWKHIWLNEGFATYAEWLWSKREDLGTAEQTFDFLYNVFPADDPFWKVTIGDPGPRRLLDFAVYARGAMTLHRLRHVVGDQDFFEILRQWAALHENKNVATWQFIALAEEISGKTLDDFFRRWLYEPKRPKLFGEGKSLTRSADLTRAPLAARSLMRRFGYR